MRAFVDSPTGAPFSIAANSTLTLQIITRTGQVLARTVIFGGTETTVAQLAATIAAQVPAVNLLPQTLFPTRPRLVLNSNSPGSSLQVTGGSANTALGFPTSVSTPGADLLRMKVGPAGMALFTLPPATARGRIG
jgi:hypothetical protein